MKIDNEISEEDWNYFLRGVAGVVVKDAPPRPLNVLWLTDATWNTTVELDYLLPAFKGILSDLTTMPCWILYGSSLVGNTHIFLSTFFKMIILSLTSVLLSGAVVPTLKPHVSGA